MNPEIMRVSPAEHPVKPKIRLFKTNNKNEKFRSRYAKNQQRFHKKTDSYRTIIDSHDAYESQLSANSRNYDITIIIIDIL
jgi:hypothetical protein